MKPFLLLPLVILVIICDQNNKSITAPPDNQETPSTSVGKYKGSLTFSQRDFIIISYARASLKKGDIEDAKKIGQRLTTPKLRLKITAAETS